MRRPGCMRKLRMRPRLLQTSACPSLEFNSNPYSNSAAECQFYDLSGCQVTLQRDKYERENCQFLEVVADFVDVKLHTSDVTLLVRAHADASRGSGRVR